MRIALTVLALVVDVLAIGMLALTFAVAKLDTATVIGLVFFLIVPAANLPAIFWGWRLADRRRAAPTEASVFD